MSLFSLGHVVCTQGINNKIAEETHFSAFVLTCLKRHVAGDWGDLDDQDKQENEYSVNRSLRLFSVYNYQCRKIWIITEADRSATTILFPEEY